MNRLKDIASLESCIMEICRDIGASQETLKNLTGSAADAARQELEASERLLDYYLEEHCKVLAGKPATRPPSH